MIAFAFIGPQAHALSDDHGEIFKATRNALNIDEEEAYGMTLLR
jgi:hypothetical protein